MRRPVALGFAIVLAIASPLWASAADSPEQQLRELIPKIVRAWESLNIGTVDPYYAKDADLTFFDIAPLSYANWGEYRAGVQKMFFEPNRRLKFTMKDDLLVHRRGALAWATFTFEADVVSKEDKSSHLVGRWTLVLEQRKAGWLVVHEHVSVPLGGA